MFMFIGLSSVSLWEVYELWVPCLSGFRVYGIPQTRPQFWRLGVRSDGIDRLLSQPCGFVWWSSLLCLCPGLLILEKPQAVTLDEGPAIFIFSTSLNDLTPYQSRAEVLVVRISTGTLRGHSPTPIIGLFRSLCVCAINSISQEIPFT